MSLPLREIYSFGPYRADSAEQTLFRDGQPIPLTPKVFDTLLVLLRHHGHLVAKDDLMSQLWPDSFVEESSLTRNISVLRKALGSGADDSSYIETVPRRGYRFRATVEVIAEPPAALVMERKIETRIVREEEEIEESEEPAARPWRVPAAVALGLLVIVSVGFAWRMWPPTGASAKPMSVVPFASFQTGVQLPSFAPDGERIAFGKWAGAEGSWDIYVKTIGNDPPLQLTSGPDGDTCPTWSPDGRQIAFLRETRGANTTSSIYVVGALGGPVRKLAELVPNRYFDLEWTTDGRYIVFAEKTDPKLPWDNFQSLALYLLSVDSLQKRQITFPDKTSGDDRFAISPDGSTLAFVRREGPFSSPASIWKVSLEGGTSTKIHEERNWIGHLAWTPDGKSILFSSEREGGSKLFQIAASGGAPEPLPFAEHDVAYPAVSRHGNRLAYVRDYQDTDLWRVEQESPRGPGKTPSVFISSVRLETAPEFSPDGRHVAYFSESSGKRELWLSDADGANAQQFTDFQASSGNAPSWSPDGKELVFASIFGPANSGGGVFAVNVESREVRRLSDDRFSMPTFSRDGRWIYASEALQRSYFELWKIPAAGGTPVQVTSHGGYFAQESPDGKTLYFFKPAGGIYKMPATGGEETLVLAELSGQSRGYWRIVSDGMYFLEAPTGGGYVLEFFEFSTQRKYPIAQMTGTPTGHHGGLTVSPDRKWIVYSQASRSANDIMLVENFH